MHLFLTGVLPFLAHSHPSAAAFLTCRHHNFHSSIIPEFLSDEKRVEHFCEARQQNRLDVLEDGKQYRNLFNLFVQTPLMQFSPSLVIFDKDCAESIVKPLLETKYFTRTLQRCSVNWRVLKINNDVLQALSNVQSLTQLDFGRFFVTNEHFETIINSFPSLETLTIDSASHLQVVDPSVPAIPQYPPAPNAMKLKRIAPPPAIRISSPPPPATRTLRSLRLDEVDALFVTKFVPHFGNLRKLELLGKCGIQYFSLNLRPLSSCLPLLTDLSVTRYMLAHIKSLNSLVHLSSLQLLYCRMSDLLSFLTQENSLPKLTTLCIEYCEIVSTSSFASLSHAPNLRVLKLASSEFNNACLHYIENMVHLRTLDLSRTKITGDCRSLKTLMQNVFQLQELNLSECNIGNQSAITGALYSTHNRLRVLNLSDCRLVDDDLNGIGALKNTLEVLELGRNHNLSNEALVHCMDLVKLKVLNLSGCPGINDLAPLKDCFNLENLDVSHCDELLDDSFKNFSEEPNSFPNLRVLNLSYCKKMTNKVFGHLSRHIASRLNEVSAVGMGVT